VIRRLPSIVTSPKKSAFPAVRLPIVIAFVVVAPLSVTLSKVDVLLIVGVHPSAGVPVTSISVPPVISTI
jgi:hypothetical protein